MRDASSSRRKSTPSSTPASSNWKNLQTILPKGPAAIRARNVEKRKIRNQTRSSLQNHHEQDTSDSVSSSQTSLKLLKILQNNTSNPSAMNQSEVGKYLAIDCEMVGVGPAGSQSVLARVSIVNYYGNVILDTYVKPKEKVTDYRTWVSGIKPENLENADNFEDAVAKVAGLIKDKILIGHAISNDLQALLLTHPRRLIRDTSTYSALHKLAKTNRPSLKKLCLLLLDLEIQTGSHSSVDDARATMAIYRTQKVQWETLVKKQQIVQQARAAGKKQLN